MMELNEFVENFAAQLDETDTALLTAETNFKELEEWSSLMALSLIAMVDEEYDIRLKSEDIRRSVTIRDLYNIVKSRS